MRELNTSAAISVMWNGGIVLTQGLAKVCRPLQTRWQVRVCVGGGQDECVGGICMCIHLGKAGVVRGIGVANSFANKMSPSHSIQKTNDWFVFPSPLLALPLPSFYFLRHFYNRNTNKQREAFSGKLNHKLIWGWRMAVGLRASRVLSGNINVRFTCLSTHTCPIFHTHAALDKCINRGRNQDEEILSCVTL